jgi:hypothetical protein
VTTERLAEIERELNAQAEDNSCELRYIEYPTEYNVELIAEVRRLRLALVDIARNTYPSIEEQVEAVLNG